MGYKISVELTAETGIHKVDFHNLPFGQYFADHMFIADYYDGDWHDCRIVPFGNLTCIRQ